MRCNVSGSAKKKYFFPRVVPVQDDADVADRHHSRSDGIFVDELEDGEHGGAGVANEKFDNYSGKENGGMTVVPYLLITGLKKNR